MPQLSALAPTLQAFFTQRLTSQLHASANTVAAWRAAPDRSTWTGRSDHALLDVAIDTGLRVSELTGLRNRDVELGTGAHLSCAGKGRKRRRTPLRKQTAAVLAVWMQERRGGPDDPLFPTRRGRKISR